VAGTLQLDGTGALVESYNELNQLLTDLRPLGMNDLIDKLMPAENDDFSVMREAALVELPGLTSSAELLDCIKTNVTHPKTQTMFAS
jgi:hypothetical protein